MRKFARTLPLVALLVGLTGCLDYDGQEIHIRYDAHKDRADALIIYRGLFSTEKDPKDALADLDGIQSGGRKIALLAHFGFGFDFDKMAEEENPLAKVLAAQMEVHSSPLWKDGDGRYCFHQLVRVNKVSEVLSAANSEFAKYLKTDEGLKAFLGEDVDPDSVRLLRDAAERKYQFFDFRHSAFVFSFPVSDVGARQFRLKLLQSAREEIEQAKENANPKTAELLLEVLARNDVGVERAGDTLAFVLGNPKRQKILVEIPSKGEYSENLVEPLKNGGYKTDRDGSVAVARRAFAVFCGEK